MTSDVTDLSGNALADFSSTFSTGATPETVRPQILTQRPTGPGIPADSDITLFVSKPLNESTVAGALYVAQNGILVEGAVTVAGDGTAIHFNPAGNFVSGAAIQVFMTDDAQDLFGNALFAYNGSFTVAQNPTTQGPTIVRTHPAQFTTGHPTNIVIDVEFSEPLLEASVTSNNFYVTNSANQPLGGTISLHNGGRTVRFTPAVTFTANLLHFVNLTAGLLDLQNTPYAGTPSFYFYAGTASDTTPPLLNGIGPRDGATDVGINATVRLHVNEPLNPLTATPATLSISSDAGPIPISVTYDATNMLVTLVPQVPLPPSTTLTVNAAGVRDAAGNELAAASTQFTTGNSADTVRPSVISTNVAAGSTNVAIDTVFQLTFSEPMDVPTVLAYADTLLYDWVVGRYLAGTATMSADGMTLTFDPDEPMAVNRQNGLFMSVPTDLAGNTMNSLSLNFFTNFGSDTTPPTVVAVNPVDGSANVPRNARVEIRFSESISAQGLGNVRLLINGSTAVAVTRVLSDSNRILTLKPNGLLTANRNYTISVSGVRDAGSNLMAGTFTSTFTTGSKSDLVVPAIIGTNPSPEDTGVGVNMVARVTFSEPLDPMSMNRDTFRMFNWQGGDVLDATVTLSADRRTATLTPASPLEPFNRYYFTIQGFTDVAGNTGSGPFLSFYTGSGSDTAAPTVRAVSPPNGTTGLPVNTKVMVVMSEAIDVTSVSNTSIQLTPATSATVTLAPDRVTLSLALPGNLAVSTAYSLLVSGLRDTTGNTMSNATFGFTTGASAAADTVAPTITLRIPSAGTAGVPLTSTISFTTSERITATAVGPSSMKVEVDAAGVRSQLGGTYTVDSTGTLVTFAATGGFPPGATIRWNNNSNGAIRDMAGLTLPNQETSFTTASAPDGGGPTVQTVTPANGATDIGPYATVTLTFSESVRPTTVNANTVALFDGPNRLSPTISMSLDNRMAFLSTVLPGDSTITIVANAGILDTAGTALTPFTSRFTTSAAFEFNRPAVISQRPTGSGVAPTTPITLFLNHPVNPATVPGAIFVSQNGVLKPGSVTVDAGNRAIVFVPTTPFADSASIEINLTSDARGVDGQFVQTYRGTFTVGINPATSVPAVRRTHPANGTNANPNTTVIDLEFSEPLNPTTVTPATVFVNDWTDATRIPGTLSLRAGNRVVRFTPTSPLPQNASNYFYVHYTSGLLDLQGAAVVDSAFFFYTNGSGDTTDPSILGIAPTDGATDVGVNSTIRIGFSGAINPVSITPETVTVSANGTPMETTVSITSNTSVTSVTLTPQRPLPTNTLITVTLVGVGDPSGDPIPATTVSFRTGVGPDYTAATSLLNITSEETNVPVNSVFEWYFSEPVDPTTVLQQTNVFWDGPTSQYIPGGTLTLSDDLRRATYVPPSTLLSGRRYWVGLSSIGDLAGNIGGGLAAWFTTSALSDLTAPQVVVTSPASGMTNVPLNARMRIAFDEPISAAALSGINVMVSGLPLPVTARTLSDGNRVLTLTLGGLLAPNTVHSLSLAGVKDRAGNTLSIVGCAARLDELEPGLREEALPRSPAAGPWPAPR